MKEYLYTIKFMSKENPEDVKFLGRSKVKFHNVTHVEKWKDLVEIPMIDEPVGIYFREDNCEEIIRLIKIHFNEYIDLFPYTAELYVCETLNDKIRNMLSPVTEVQAILKEYKETKNPMLLDHLLEYGDELLQTAIDELLKL